MGKKWEYHVESIKSPTTIDKVNHILNEVGFMGWELIDSCTIIGEGWTQNTRYHFKREIE